MYYLRTLLRETKKPRCLSASLIECYDKTLHIIEPLLIGLNA
jgi:hypothetical protein